MKKIAFIGLGHMGGPMAANLVKGGFETAGADLSTAALDKFAEAGGRKAANIADAVKDADVVVTMLPSGKEVRAIYLGAQGLVETLPKGRLFIDCSTIDVATAREVGEKAATKGHGFVDAPVSGGTTGAEAGTLTFMVGGNDDVFKKAEPVLSKMGKTIVHAGGIGNGQAAKICNNMLLGISMIGVSEAFNLADGLGLPREKLFEIANTSSGQCWSLSKYCPVPGPVPTSPANRDYAPGFTVAMMLKDLRLAQDAANSVRASTPLGAEAAQIYALMSGQGNDNVDFSGVFKFLQNKKS
ncbi:MAG: 3-hydroxyisobutyrate dehydrogenase [Pseudomonadota bacterium]